MRRMAILSIPDTENPLGPAQRSWKLAASTNPTLESRLELRRMAKGGGPRALIAVTAHGRRLAQRIDGELLEGSPREGIEQAWSSGREIVFFGAVGIAV